MATNHAGNGGRTVSSTRRQADLFASPADSPTPPADRTPAAPKRRGRRAAPQTAQTMAKRQREISVSEFFTKNRHLLGFDNPRKALLTTVKEAVDNSLDACEEAQILPEISVQILPAGENRFRVVVEDNGPGIVKAQIPNIFGRLLYGSKFHTLKQSRGQQGIGISAAGMYGSLTTGQPVKIVSRTSKRQPAHYYELQIDTRKNAPRITKDRVFEEWDKDSGTRVEIQLEGVYHKGRRSVDDYIAQCALANPHASFHYWAPGTEELLFARVTDEQPAETVAIQPHPHGVELGALIKMLQDTAEKEVRAALQADFSRVTSKVAKEICDRAGLRGDENPRRLGNGAIERIFSAIPEVKILPPPASCLSPIGDEKLVAALRDRVPADFYAALTRKPEVYRGNPFQVEMALAYGGQLSGDDLIDLRRFANRVPLAYQQSACAITKAAMQVDWKKYQLQQARGALPSGPVLIMVHIASVWVPFTSESKEAIAHYPEILREVKLGLMDLGRRLGQWLRAKKRAEVEHKKRERIRKYIPHLVIGLQQIMGFDDGLRDKTIDELSDYLERSRKPVKV